ncbi:MAG: TIM barrel protein [Armatimonadetes bacterium]|nr:TIM barrel protein [Armatimonadota bacterium]MDW8153465.1 TIM barrel protein [Armatimonadota bacterium]
MPLRDLRGQTVRRSGEELVRHLQHFVLEPKFSVGVWYLSPFASRFHDKYTPDRDLPARLDLIASLKGRGVVGVEAHYPTELNEDNLDRWRAFIRDTGIRLVALAPGIFYDRDFEFGALSSHLPEVRRKAIQRTIRTLELCRELAADVAILWPGIDGYENPFGQNFAELRARFAEGLAEAMDAVPGVRVAFEPKPYEPRGRILFGTTAEGLLLAHRVEGMLSHPENRRLLQEGHAGGPGIAGGQREDRGGSRPGHRASDGNACGGGSGRPGSPGGGDGDRTGGARLRYHRHLRGGVRAPGRVEGGSPWEGTHLLRRGSGEMACNGGDAGGRGGRCAGCGRRSG